MTSWAEGDALSPSNLNTRVPSWVSSANTGVILPANISGLPAPVLNVKTDFAAHGDDTTDDFAAIQSAISNANASADTNGIRTIHFPPGRYHLSQPLWITTSGVQLVGDMQGIGTRFIGSNAGAAALVSTHQGGPTVLVCSSTITTPGLVAPLVGSVGSGYNDTALAAAANRWWNLRDLKTMDLNGLSQFCVDYFYQGTYTGVNGAVVVESSGQFAGVDHQALRIYNVSGAAFCQATIGGTIKTVQDPATTISNGAVHHIRHNFDGSNLRTFVDGTLKATTAASGTLTQHFAEEVYYGSNRFAQELGGLNDAIGGTVFSLRIDNTSHETTNFTAPTSAHTVTANTLVLLNHDLQRGPMTRVQTKDGDGWAVQRQTFPNSDIYGFGVKGLTFDSTSAAATALHFVGNVEFWTAEHLYFVAVRRGLFGPDEGNRFQWAAHHLHFRGQSAFPMRTGIALGLFALAGCLETIWFFGDVLIPLSITDGDVSLDNIFVNTNTNTCVGLWFQNANASSAPLALNNFNVNTESGVSSAWTAGLVIRGSLGYGGISANGCGFENGGTSWIFADTPSSMKFTECAFIKTSGTPASIMRAAGTFGQPAKFDSCEQPNGWVPWSNVTGNATVAQIGPLFSSSTGSTLNFDASVADEWDLTLSSDVTKSNWTKISYGQPVSGAIKMDSTGSRLFVWPTNSKGTATLSYGSAAVNTFTGFYDGVNVILTSVRTGL